jgi:hypothetical protein
MRHRRIPVLAAIGLAALSLAVVPARAQIIISAGNNPQPNEENVLLNNGTTGNPVFGMTQQSNIQVSLSSVTGQTLTEPSSGQARVEAISGLTQVALTSLLVGIPGPGSFEDLIFNASVTGGVGGSGTIRIEASPVGGGASTSADFNLGNGSNFFTVIGINGVRIESVQITSLTGDGMTDVRQIRISGASETGRPPASVPEPGSYALLGGLAVPGAAMLLRRRRA